jgi:hypothetical protein
MMKKFRLLKVKWLQEQPEEFHIDRFKILVQCWQHCIEQEGDYVQK